MPTYIVRLDAERPLYMEWSTIVDAPMSALMPREQFVRYYMERYQDEYEDRNHARRHLDRRIARASARGTNAHSGVSAEQLLACNSAGLNEKALTPSEMLEQYRVPMALCDGRIDKAWSMHPVACAANQEYPMRMRVEREGITIVAETEQDRAYFEDTLKLGIGRPVVRQGRNGTHALEIRSADSELLPNSRWPDAAG